MVEDADNPCLTCGACCGPVLQLRGVVRSDGEPCVTHRGRVMCSGLRGNVGVHVSCSIYEHRPEACQMFQPGSAACNDARKMHGLGSLT